MTRKSRRVAVDRRRLTGRAWRTVCPVGTCHSTLARNERTTRGDLRAGCLTHLASCHGHLTTAERSALADAMVFDAKLTEVP